MASKKAHVISVYINRNITSKLIGRNSPIDPVLFRSMDWHSASLQTSCNKYLSHKQKDTRFFSWALKLRWSGIWRLFVEEKAEQIRNV